jgi:protease IV
LRGKTRYYVKLHLKADVVEGRAEHGLLSTKSRTSLHDTLRVLDNAARDRRVAALFLLLEDISAGWARLTDLRRGVLRFRETGKPVWGFVPSGGNSEYYLASACDRIYMPPAASLRLVGLASEVFFFRELLDRFGLEPQLASVGEFKSAGEMVTRTGMSAPAREQLDELLDDFSLEFRRALAQGRRFSEGDMEAAINAGPYTAREAARSGLIEGICYEDELDGKLKEALGSRLESIEPVRFVRRPGFLRRIWTWRRPRIGVIDVLGTITGGETRRDRTGRHVAGVETLGAFVEHARKSRRVRAVVLRIDSPGGTGTASDELWRKLSLLAEAKPLVVSFGDVAASGGYYIAAPGSRIFAEPMSITGSIGVLGGKVVARGLMAQLSIHREVLTRGNHAEFDSLFAPFSPAENERLQSQLDEFYREDFVRKVAAGRKMTVEAVDHAGRGRIWSGARALTLGLVDQMGGLGEAIAEARRLAGLEEPKRARIAYYQRRRRLRDLFVPDFAPHFAAWLPNPAAETLATLRQLAKSSVMLLMPFQIRIR